MSLHHLWVLPPGRRSSECRWWRHNRWLACVSPPARPIGRFCHRMKKQNCHVTDRQTTQLIYKIIKIIYIYIYKVWEKAFRLPMERNTSDLLFESKTVVALGGGLCINSGYIDCAFVHFYVYNLYHTLWTQAWPFGIRVSFCTRSCPRVKVLHSTYKQNKKNL